MLTSVASLRLDEKEIWIEEDKPLDPRSDKDWLHHDIRSVLVFARGNRDKSLKSTHSRIS